MERGKLKKLPNKEMIVKIANALAVMPEELLGADTFVLARFSEEVQQWLMSDRSTDAVNRAFLKDMEERVQRRSAKYTEEEIG